MNDVNKGNYLETERKKRNLIYSDVTCQKLICQRERSLYFFAGHTHSTQSPVDPPSRPQSHKARASAQPPAEPPSYPWRLAPRAVVPPGLYVVAR